MVRRIVCVYAVLMLFLVVAALGTASAALGNDTYVEAVGRQSMYKLNVSKSRGTIYDRNLNPLTNASEQYIAAVVPSVESLARLNSITDSNQIEELRIGLENGSPFLVRVNSPVSTEGISSFCVDARYSDPQPASNLIGYLENGSTGSSGLEKSFDEELQENGSISVTFTVDALGRSITGVQKNVEDTYSDDHRGIAVTLDKEIQMLVESTCTDIQKGAAVVLECETGQILAMASFPALDPNRLGEAMQDPDAPFLNRALCAYAPGSVFKLISAAAAMESGADYRETYTCNGSIHVDGLDFACYAHTPHGSVNMHTAIRQSCNGYFVNLLQQIDPLCVLDLAVQMGLSAPIGLADGLAAVSGTLPSAETLHSPRACANFSFGQGETTVTPLHMTAFVNAIAMGGEYIVPQLYIGTVNTELEISGSVSFESRKVMERITADRLRAYMESTAKYGTARVGAPRNCVSGIKTGTAQTGVSDESGAEIMNYWYAGYICDAEENPQYTLVILEESSEKTNVPAAFKKIAETLVDFI